MDPNILEERVRSLSEIMDIVTYVMIGVGSITVAVVIALLAMFFVITNQLSSLNRTTASLEAKFDGLETKFDGLRNQFADEIALRHERPAA